MSVVLTDDQAKVFLAANLRRILAARKLSLRALGRLINETPMRLSNISRGAVIPDVACVSRIAEALDVSIEALLRPCEEKTSSTVDTL